MAYRLAVLKDRGDAKLKVNMAGASSCVIGAEAVPMTDAVAWAITVMVITSPAASDDWAKAPYAYAYAYTVMVDTETVNGLDVTPKPKLPATLSQKVADVGSVP
jgi:hypothetical protein